MRLFIIAPGVRVKACGFPNPMNPKEWIQQRKCQKREKREVKGQNKCIFGVKDLFYNSDIGGSSICIYQNRILIYSEEYQFLSWTSAPSYPPLCPTYTYNSASHRISSHSYPQQSWHRSRKQIHSSDYAHMISKMILNSLMVSP